MHDSVMKMPGISPLHYRPAACMPLSLAPTGKIGDSDCRLVTRNSEWKIIGNLSLHTHVDVSIQLKEETVKTSNLVTSALFTRQTAKTSEGGPREETTRKDLASLHEVIRIVAEVI